MTGYWCIYNGGDLGSARISKNVCHRINQRFPGAMFCWVLASRGRSGETFASVTRAPPPECARFDDESTGRWTKSPPFPPRHAPLCCGLLSAQEWGFAARLLGAAGRCLQSVACSLACRAPRVSSAPEGRQTERRQCLTPKQLSDTFVFSSQRGYVPLWGEKWQKECFLETGPRANKTTVVLSYVYFFSVNVIFSPCLRVVGLLSTPQPPFFSLSRLNSKLLVLCCYINTFWVKPKKTASSNRPITRDVSRILQPESLTLEIMYSCWRVGWNKFNYGSCEDYVPADRSDIWDFASPSTTSLLRGF